MKLTGMRFRIALITAAAVCLLMAPALSMPMDRGMGMERHGGMLFAINNVTPEQMGNMTLGEIREMSQKAWSNSTACPAGNAGQNCSQWQNQGRASDKRLAGNAGLRGAVSARYIGQPGAHGIVAGGPSPLLLMDDITVEKLGNMTLNQIRELQQKKMQDLDNMTLNQIQELSQKKIQVLNNMTLSDLLKEKRNMQAIAKIMDLGSIRNGFQA